jgi:hypothetical protein
MLRIICISCLSNYFRHIVPCLKREDEKAFERWSSSRQASLLCCICHLGCPFFFLLESLFSSYERAWSLFLYRSAHELCPAFSRLFARPAAWSRSLIFWHALAFLAVQSIVACRFWVRRTRMVCSTNWFGELIKDIIANGIPTLVNSIPIVDLNVATVILTSSTVSVHKAGYFSAIPKQQTELWYTY